MFWELDGDRDGELIGTFADKVRTGAPGEGDTPGNGTDPDPGTDPEPDPDPGACAAAPWSSTEAYSGGAKVSHEGAEYTAKWWTQGDQPGANAVWEKVGDCDSTDPGTDPDPDPDACAAAWSAGTAYPGGSTVSYQGSEYTAKWWTQGEQPGASEWGAWRLVAACG